MNKLVSLRTCAKLLGIHPVQLSRWVKTYPFKIKVHKISSREAMRPNTVKKAPLEEKCKPRPRKARSSSVAARWDSSLERAVL